ncbi:MAG: glucose-6-phosphate isomerase [Gammaproteobacteria bacterium]
MTKLTKLNEWAVLTQHQQAIAKIHLHDLFEQNPTRFQDHTLDAGDLWLDYSKNHVTQQTVEHLCQLAHRLNLNEKIEQLFCAGMVNFTEKRAALHTALRNRNQQTFYYNNENIMPEISANLNKMHAVSEQLRQGSYCGYTGKAITDIVNIGIGGSDLGTSMAYEALRPYASKKLKLHFLANIDGYELEDKLAKLSPQTTVFIIASKSFTTLETLTNATTIKQWLNDPKAIKKQFMAITAKRQKAIDFGIDANHIFAINDCVGGRFSLWSAMGLPLAIAIGMKNFEDLLDGAYAMDQHFKSTDFNKNMPVMLALISIWYSNFFNANTHAVLPYTQQLRLLPAFLQQLHMESNGKQVNAHGEIVEHTTSPVLWGRAGSHGQHAFHQLLHQGKHLIPIDFIVAINSHSQYKNHHKQLVAHCFSQSEALMLGNNKQATQLATHKQIPGNKPSNTIIMKKLTPRTLGALIALYEHKVFVQSIIWEINAFDQFGVDLGKSATAKILEALEKKQKNNTVCQPTQGLIDYFHRYTHHS